MRAIAAEAEISPPLLQYYFPSRDELLMAVIEAWDEENEQRSPGSSSFRGWVRSLRHNAEVAGLVHLFTATLVEAIDDGHPAREFFRQRYEKYTRNTTAEIERQQRAGTAPAHLDPERTARILLAASEGLEVRWLHSPDFDMADEFAYLVESLGLEVPLVESADPASDN